MKIPKRLLYIVGLFVLLSVIFTNGVIAKSESNKKIKAGTFKKGELDLTNWNFERDGIIDLKGEWEFYWEKLLTPIDFVNNTNLKPTGFIKFPQMWAGSKIGDVTLPNTGHATYKARVKLPKIEGLFKIKVYECLSSYKLFVNGKEAIALGEPGKSLEGSKAQGNSRFYTFPTNGGYVDLVLQISNYYLNNGGTYMPIKLGLEHQIDTRSRLEMIIDAFLIGCILIMGVYHLALYILRRKNKTTLIFGVFCISLGIRAGLAGDGDFIFLVLPEMSWDWTKKLEFIGFYVGIATFYHFVRMVFPDEQPKWFLWVIWPATILFSLYTVFTRAYYFTDVILYYQICTLLSIILMFYSVGLALYRKKNGSLIFLTGIIALFSATIYDILLAHEIVNTMPMAPVGILCFIFAQSLLLSRRFSNAFTQVEIDAVKIKKMHSELIEKERARTLFFHNTSHELRTPLNGIIGFLEILKLGRYGKLADKVRGQLNKISTLAESLKLQVNTILDLAKEKKGEIKLVNAMISMDDVVDYTNTLAEGLSKKEGVSFNLESEWNGAAEGVFVCDREKLNVVIRNLLGNAFKFKATDRDNDVKFYISFDPKQLKIIISDTGVGIPDEFRSRMFKEFEQVTKDASRGYEGTGLGLALVKKLLDVMNGTIEFESIVGRGTTFTVIIPPQLQVDATHTVKPEVKEIVKESEAELEGEEDYVPEEVDSQEAEMNAEKDYQILVVDDNEINLEVISETLKIHNYNVDVAEGGQEALDSLKYTEKKPDLIILDLMMPEVSGEDVLKSVKMDDGLRDIPIMLLTARASQDDKVFGLGLGADDYLAKPIENKELLLRVKNLLMRVDLARLMESYMYREKMAQMGELMGDMSHELKNIHQANSVDGSIEQKRVEKLLKNKPIKSNDWNEIIESQYKENVDYRTINERSQLLSPPADLEKSDKKIFIGLARILRKLDVKEKSLEGVWDEILKLESISREEIEAVMVLYEIIKMKTVSGKRAYDLLMSILDYSRESDTTDCKIGDVMHDTALLLGAKLRKAKVHLEIDVDQSEVVANSSDMHQIVVNLVTNSCHALSDIDQTEKIIRVKQRVDKSEITYQFEDNGAGIPEENISKIFERNFTTKGAKGSGIGLFVSQRLANKNNGGLSVTSEPGKTVFELKLKRK